MREILQTLKYIFYLLYINTCSALSLKASFILNVILMALNNLIFFVIWLILFAKVDQIRGWRLEECALMFGLTALSAGGACVLFGGSWSLGRIISESELDVYMALPKSTLISASASHSMVSGWGDVLSGIVLLVFSGYLNYFSLITVFITSICGIILFLSVNITVHSLAFWLGPVNSFSRQLFEGVLMFCLYPESIFTGYLRLCLFTIIPAGFISYLPIDLVRDFAWDKGLFLLLATFFYFFLSILIFNTGLKRYCSGSRILFSR